jgi:hypothetical protein
MKFHGVSSGRDAGHSTLRVGFLLICCRRVPLVMVSKESLKPSSLSERTLEHLCIRACTLKFDQEQWKHTGLAQHNCKTRSGWWNAQKHCAHAEQSIGNMIWLLLSVSDWPITLIAPGGLLLVVSHLFAVQVSVLWVVKKEITKHGCEKYFG